MPSTFGQWLIVILALVLGGAGGWLARGRQAVATARQPEPMVEGDPVVGLSEQEKAAATVSATIDTPRPAATVDASPAPAAVVDTHTPHDLDAPPAAASLAADHTPLTADEDTAAADTVAGPVAVADVAVADAAPNRTDSLDATGDRTDADILDGRADAVEADAERVVEPVAPAEVAVDERPVHAEAGPTGDEATPQLTSASAEKPVTAEEPVAAEEPVTAEKPVTAEEPVAAEDAERRDEDAERRDEDEAAERPAEVGVPAAAAAAAAPVGTPAAQTPVIPAPREAAEDEAPADDAAPVVAATPVATDEDAPADDFRRIQGVGPKMATALQAAGIRTYRQLAELDEAALRDTIRAAGLRAAPSLATWPQQAKVLAGAGAEAGAVLPGPGADQL